MVGSLVAGRYRLDGVIGEGGVAVVYKAFDITLERDVAVKVLREELVANPESVARFRREAHAAAKLNHPNIVQIYDTGVDDDIYFIVMEYLPEPDLKKIIQEYSPLPLRKVLEVCTQCARALAYAHKQGLVHRDIKPHNILFTNDGRVKLSDFGIAAVIGEHGVTEGGLVLGSAYYISPEQAQGGPATIQSDLYSLGVVMFECLTGRTPYTGATGAEVAAKHVRERPPSARSLNPNITPSAEFVINKCMARETSRRYRSADELLVDLEKLADGMELDRTGVLGPINEEATMRLSPSEVPASSGYATPAPPPRTPPAARPETASQRAAESAPNNTALVTAIVVVVAITALLGVVWLIKSVIYPGEAPTNVQVPMVTGMTEVEARLALEEAGLKRGSVSYEEDDSAPEGTVIRQVPGFGEMVATGTQVNLTISRGKKTVTVPNIRGRTLAEATERLEGASLHIGEVEEIFHETVPQGLIVRQGIPAGTVVEAGASVAVTVSKGKEELPEEPQPTQPAETEPRTNDTGPVVDDPDVQVQRDLSYRADDPNVRRLVVKITAMGQESGQQVKIMKSDDQGPGVSVATERLDPGRSIERTVRVVGNATIEVYHNNRLVFSEDYPVESATP